LGWDAYDDYVDEYYLEIQTHTSVHELLCLVDKPIVGILEDPDEDYGPIYTGAPGIPQMVSHIQIYAFMNPTL